MAKWSVGDVVEITTPHRYYDGYYGGYYAGYTGVITEVRHNYLRVVLDQSPFKFPHKVLKRECTKIKSSEIVLNRIKLMHSRQSEKHPFMEKKYA